MSNNIDNNQNEWIELRHDTDFEIMTEEPYSIRKKSTGKIVAECTKPNGYIYVALNRRNFYKHRIIAEMFIPNPDNLNEVDHCNGMRNDNRLENLRFVSRSDNNKNRGSVNNINYNYIDELPEDAIEVNHYSRWQFEDLYFSPENNTFYYYNGARYRELYNNEDKKTGALYVYAYDTNNKRHQILYNKFKREYHLI